jgi:hypothetical protein
MKARITIDVQYDIIASSEDEAYDKLFDQVNNDKFDSYCGHIKPNKELVDGSVEILWSEKE